MVAAYLDGYHAALQQLTGQNRDQTEWNGFRLWLADRCYKSHGIDRNLGWQSYIAKMYPDDETRFHQLPILFRAYQMWVAEGNDPLSFYTQWLA